MLIETGKKAKTAARALARLTTAQKNAALENLAAALLADRDAILAANERDVKAGRADGLSAALIDRLMLNEARLVGIAEGLRSVAALPDPVGEVFDETTLPNGLQVRKQRVPLG